MKKKKTILGAGVLSLLLVVGVVMSASAYQGDYTVRGPEYSAERHDAMTDAFENIDYSAWVEQMSDRGRVTQVINEDNFAQFAEAHKLASEGDYAGADAIRAELGLRTSDGARQGQGYRGGHGAGKGQRGGQGSHGAGFVDVNGDGVCDNMN